jgi:tetratricopeptide (TPR) repeat protein
MLDTKAWWGTRESAILFFTETQAYNDSLIQFDGLNRDLEPNLLLAKAFCFLSRGHFPQALECLQVGENKQWMLPELFTLKGRALYGLKEFQTAKCAFEKSNQCQPDPETQRWIRRCAIEIEMAENPQSSRMVQIQSDLPELEQIKHEWHQTETILLLLLSVRILTKSQLRIDFQERWIQILIDDKNPLGLTVTLAKSVQMQEPDIQVKSEKVEIRFVKADDAIGEWGDIEIVDS